MDNMSAISTKIFVPLESDIIPLDETNFILRKIFQTKINTC